MGDLSFANNQMLLIAELASTIFVQGKTTEIEQNVYRGNMMTFNNFANQNFTTVI